jgi:hypothetical protein
VGVMMAAEILKQYEFGCTLRFINFNAEEYGLIGSQKYARQTYCGGEEVRGVINLDMIAWNTAGSPAEMDLHALPSIPGSMEIAGLFNEVVSAYGLDLQPTNATSPTSASDHASFWRYNYPAILASEDFADFNDFYHSSQDSLGNLPDMNYYTEMVKASLGTLAHMGCLVEGGRGTVSGTIREEATNLSIPGAQVTLHNPEWGYTLLANSDQDGHYQISAPAGWHEISADAHGYAFLPPSDIYINQSQAVQENLALDSMAEIAYFFPVLYNSIPIPAGCP